MSRQGVTTALRQIQGVLRDAYESAETRDDLAAMDAIKGAMIDVAIIGNGTKLAPESTHRSKVDEWNARRVIRMARGNITEAAELMGVSRATLYRLIPIMGLQDHVRECRRRIGPD